MQCTNKSGIEPIDTRVLIRPDEAPVKLGSIHLPEQVREKDEAATTRGVIVAMGAPAFEHLEPADRPQIGDAVAFKRFGYVKVRGVDGVDYWLVKADDVHARYVEAKA